MSGFVYAVEFSNGTVKVGKTSDVASRIYSHQHHARAVGVDVMMIVISTEVENENSAEKIILEGMKKIREIHSREYFKNASASDVTSIMKERNIPYILCRQVKKVTHKGVSSYMAEIIPSGNISDLRPPAYELENRIKSFVEKNKGISMGVIVNKMRKEKDVKGAVYRMEEIGELRVERSTHPKKSTCIEKIYLA